MVNRAWQAAMAAAVLAGASPRPAWAADSAQGSPSLADDRAIVALAVALACGEPSEARSASPAPAATGPATQASTGSAPADDGPQLELVATVRAKALRFDVVPQAPVVLQGARTRKTVWNTERVNLPPHPQPGIVYRDVAVRLTVTGDGAELAALLREAKRASAGVVLDEAAAAPPGPASPVPVASASPSAVTDAAPAPAPGRAP